MSDVKIKKAKIKDELFLEVEYVEQLPGHSKKDTKLNSTVPVHDDLKTAFQWLHKHLAILCDQVPVPNKKAFQQANYDEYIVRGFAIGGKEEDEGVTITGSKTGRFGWITLNTPFVRFQDDDYAYIKDLKTDIEAAKHEVDQYLFHEKRAPEQQLELALNQEETDD